MEGDKNTYSQVSDAVKAAGDASKKKSKRGARVPVAVTLEAVEYKVGAKLTVPPGVHIIGSEAGASVSTLAFGSNVSGTAVSVSNGGAVVVRNVRVQVAGARKSEGAKVVVVGQGKGVELDNLQVVAEESEFSKVGVSVGAGAEVALRNSTLQGCSVVFEKGSSGSVSGTTISLAAMGEEESCGLSFFGEQLSVSNSEVTNFAVGILLHGNAVNVENTKVSAKLVGIDLGSGEIKLDKGCQVSASEGRAIKARENTNSEVLGATITDSNVGVTMEEGALMKLSGCKFKALQLVGISVDRRASLELRDSSIEGSGVEAQGGQKVDAITVTKASTAALFDCTISQVSGRAMAVDGEASKVRFTNLTVQECGDRCILVSGGGRVTGKSGKIHTSQGICLHLNDQGSYAEIQEVGCYASVTMAFDLNLFVDGTSWREHWRADQAGRYGRL